MRPSSVPAFRAAAVSGFLGIALGAFGAHGLRGVFASNPAAAHWWETAVFYHLLHTVVLLVAAFLEPFPALAWRLLMVGIILFSGSLYLMTLSNITRLGAITPLGGLCFLTGWLLLAFRRTEVRA